MQYSHRLLFSEEMSSDDEIDNLFNQLQHVEPPRSLVERIMNAVAHLSHLPPSLPSTAWDDQDDCVMRRDHLTPS